MPHTTGCHPAEAPVDSLLAACQIERGRRSGPGGQHRNKVETAIRIRHEPTGVSAEATERRSQEENRQVAIGRLRLNLALRVRSVRAVDQVPSPLWRTRATAAGRLSISPRHPDFPALLAEALDLLETSGWEPRTAAERLGVTASQLIRLLKLEPQALVLLNSQRQQRGLHRLQ
ncbi:MAG: peptide chain release factor-like protein [Pirellulaceae bacterium]|nr:peptide chain release factor-like protein [Pirellulaceae bacterium]